MMEILKELVFCKSKGDKEMWCFGLLVCWMLVLLSCKPKLEPSFEGVFVNVARGEFSEAHDTLRVLKAGADYFIFRHTGIIWLDDHGKKSKPMLQHDRWKLHLDKGKNVLIERNKGRIISLAGDTLSWGSAAYHRLPLKL